MLPTSPNPLARLPLRAELYLIAHDDDHGTPHIHPQSLAVGLAGAILLELWLAGRVYIGWRYDPSVGNYTPDPGRILVTDPNPIGDPLADAALAALRLRPASGGVRAWIHRFAATDLYPRVRAAMVAVGVLTHTSRRRYGLVKTDTYPAVDTCWAVRTRARLREVVHTYAHPHRAGLVEPPDEQCVALCGLVNVLELAPYLYAGNMPTVRLRQWLGHIVDQYHPTLAEVITAVDACRSDLAVAALR